MQPCRKDTEDRRLCRYVRGNLCGIRDVIGRRGDGFLGLDAIIQDQRQHLGGVEPRFFTLYSRTAVGPRRRPCSLPLAGGARLTGLSASRSSRTRAEPEKGGMPGAAAKLWERYKDKH